MIFRSHGGTGPTGCEIFPHQKGNMNTLPKIFVSIGLAADERQLLAQGRVLGVADGGGTSGEMRVCNFLLWQISYAEFVITPTLWPDFRKL